jgi:hypothetical protein
MTASHILFVMTVSRTFFCGLRNALAIAVLSHNCTALPSIAQVLLDDNAVPAGIVTQTIGRLASTGLRKRRRNEH